MKKQLWGVLSRKAAKLSLNHKRIQRTAAFGAFGLALALITSVGVFDLTQRQVFAGSGAIVSVFADGEEQVVATDATTVGELLARLGVVINDGDLVEPAVNTEVVSGSFNVNVYRARSVLVVDGDDEHLVRSAYTNPELIIEESAGLELYPEDGYNVELIQDFVQNRAVGLKVTIVRATPVKVMIDGEEHIIRTHADTVGQLLDEQGYVLGAQDFVSVAREQAVVKDGVVQIVRVGSDSTAVHENIAFGTRYVYDDSQPTSFSEVQQAGVNGEKVVTYKVTTHNGQEVSREPIQELILKQPVEQVILKGSQPTGDAFEVVRMCESGGNYQAVNPIGYYGAYQFGIGTWDSLAAAERPELAGVRPDQAAPADQDDMARRLQARRGWSPWPHCGAGL